MKMRSGQAEKEIRFQFDISYTISYDEVKLNNKHDQILDDIQSV